MVFPASSARRALVSGNSISRIFFSICGILLSHALRHNGERRVRLLPWFAAAATVPRETCCAMFDSA